MIECELLLKSEAHVQALGHSAFHAGIEIAEVDYEKFDGSGYPSGLKCQDSPLPARIIAEACIAEHAGKIRQAQARVGLIGLL